MPPVINLSGKTFGKLLVISRSQINTREAAHWNCICECGQSKVVRGSALRNGLTTSFIGRL
jgi:hypothetical protein